MRPPGPDQIPSWLVVLPDTAAAGEAAAALRPHATHEIAHASGRPWLLVRGAEGPVVVGHAGDVQIAVAGQHAVSTHELAAVAARTRSIGDLDRLARALVGSAHLIASVGGCARVQGSVTGLRRVFYGTIGGATVAADRADVLAALLDADLDHRCLALSLLNTSLLYPLAGQPVWRGVDVLLGDHYLGLDADGQRRCVRWWTPPEPVVPLAEGARGLRDALAAAVDVRVRGQRVSSDLGGLDSTSLCCLAARGSDEVVAYTADGWDPMTGDVAWARRTLTSLVNIEHHVISAEQLPMAYGGVLDVDELLDAPCSGTVHASRYLFIPRAAAARGARVHLTGVGGDELLAGSPAHLHGLVRTHPKTALANARAFAVQRRWRYGDVLRQLLDRRPYRAWLAAAAEHLTALPPSSGTPTLDWGPSPRLPPWATPEAVCAVRELVLDAARTAEPLATRRGQHVELEAMRASSRLVAQFDRMVAPLGIELAAPYFDDRVLEAGLAVRPEERVTPWRYKPLVVEAMRGIVPDETLTRDTKDEGSYEVEAGWQRHRRELLSLFEGSRLDELGLIDEHALRELCSRPLPPSLDLDVLYQTVACEVWLRGLGARPSKVNGKGDGAQAA